MRIDKTLQRAMKCLSFYLLFFVIGAVLFSSSSFAAVTDFQKPILVKKSQRTFNIILKSNPTTGYIWVLNQFDALMVKPMKRIYHAPVTNATHKAFVGASGYEEWRFMLNKPTVPILTKI
jgi:predicted secreted protein